MYLIDKDPIMKSCILISALVACTVSVSAQSSDYDQIVQAVNYYLEGGTNNDFEMLSKAFHPTATMKYITDEGYKEVNALDFFKKAMKPGPPQKRHTRIADISYAGHAANARLEIEYETFTFIDFMNLLKIEGEWKVVNKIFYRRM